MSTRGTPDELLAVVDGLDPVALAVALSLLHSNDALVVAARLGVEMNEARREWRRTLRETSADVHGSMPRGYWARTANEHVPYAELQRRRGVEIGPDGRPRGVRPPGDTRTDHEGAA